MKRPSGTKPSPTPPEPTFFTDRDLGKIFPRILRENGLTVERYSDHFGERNVPNQEWIAHTARNRWVALSHDKNIRWDPLAIRTVMEEGARLFIVRGKHLTGPEKAGLFLQAESAVRRLLVRQRSEAFIATIHRATSQSGGFRAEVEISPAFSEWDKRRAVER